MTARRRHSPTTMAYVRSALAALCCAILCLTGAALMPDSFMRGPTEPRGGAKPTGVRSHSGRGGGLSGVGHKLYAASGKDPSTVTREFELTGSQQAKSIEIPLRPLRILLVLTAGGCLVLCCTRTVQAASAAMPQPDPTSDLPRIGPMP